MKQNLDTEKVPLVIIYKKKGDLHIEFEPDYDQWQVYGFLKIFLKNMELDLIQGTEDEYEDENL